LLIYRNGDQCSNILTNHKYLVYLVGHHDNGPRFDFDWCKNYHTQPGTSISRHDAAGKLNGRVYVFGGADREVLAR